MDVSLKVVLLLTMKEYRIALWKNKNSHKAIFILDNIALKLYNIIVKQTNAL